MHAQSLFVLAAMAGLSMALPSSPAIHFPAGFGPKPLMPSTNVTHVQPDSTTSSDGAVASTFYSSNWAGVIQGAASGQSFKSAIGTVTLPTCGHGASGNGPWYNAYWVGIDGYTNGNALLQAGVICEYTSSGTRTYTPWVEYYPNPLIYLKNFPMSAGDAVTVKITVTSPTSGTLAIADKTTGQSTTTTLNAPAATNTLTGSSAEWILEDFSSNGGLVPFASFSNCDWSASTAQYKSGTTVNADGSGYTTVILENSNGQQITSDTISSATEFIIKYTGAT